jgi:ribosomal-protein-alanine N-acetyltransferase
MLASVITTARLRLDPFTIETAQATADGTRADLPWAEGFPREDDRDAARMFLRAPDFTFGSWFIVVQDRAGIVGSIGFYGPPDTDGELMVGYGLIASARGHGYATEALVALTDHAFAQPGVSRIVADPDLDNTASHRVLEKAGFVGTHSTDTSHWYVNARSGR